MTITHNRVSYAPGPVTLAVKPGAHATRRAAWAHAGQIVMKALPSGTITLPDATGTASALWTVPVASEHVSVAFNRFGREVIAIQSEPGTIFAKWFADAVTTAPSSRTWAGIDPILVYDQILNPALTDAASTVGCYYILPGVNGIWLRTSSDGFATATLVVKLPFRPIVLRAGERAGLTWTLTVLDSKMREVVLTSFPYPVPIISVTAIASPSSIATSAATTITAVIANGNGVDGVTWSIVSGGGSLSGSTAFTVVYTAGAGSGTPVIRATSIENPTKTADIAITVTAVLSVAASASPTTVALSAASTITAVITNGNGIDGVTWSIVSGGGSLSGATALTVVYTANATPGTKVILATSVQDPTKSTTVNVTAAAIPTSLRFFDRTECIGPLEVVQFGVVISGGLGNAGGVTVTVQSGGGSVAYDSDTGSRLLYNYTAPVGVATVVLRATSNQLPTLYNECTIRVATIVKTLWTATSLNAASATITPGWVNYIFAADTENSDSFLCQGRITGTRPAFVTDHFTGTPSAISSFNTADSAMRLPMRDVRQHTVKCSVSSLSAYLINLVYIGEDRLTIRVVLALSQHSGAMKFDMFLDGTATHRLSAALTYGQVYEATVKTTYSAGTQTAELLVDGVSIGSFTVAVDLRAQWIDWTPNASGAATDTTLDWYSFKTESP